MQRIEFSQADVDTFQSPLPPRYQKRWVGSLWWEKVASHSAAKSAKTQKFRQFTRRPGA
jgi:hypothetical protein